MGTNYFAVRNRPSTERNIHIGKSSLGWKFLFQEQSDTWREPPIEWHSYEQVYDWLHKNVVETKEFVIMDEYDRIVPFDKFIELVDLKQNENNPEDFKYNKNVGGYRFDEREFF